MPLQKLPTANLDDINHRRRSRETLNKILDHSFDDSRVRTPAEVAAGIIPVNYAYAPGDARRYGWSATNTGAQNYAALVAANAAATQAGDRLFIPSGVYPYDPSAVIEITCEWTGANVYNTIIDCTGSSYTGEFFRLVGSNEIYDLWLKNDSQDGIALRLAAASTPDFTGHQRVTRVWVFGFEYGFRCENVFALTLDQCRAEENIEGFYCVPDNTGGGDRGYVTTHIHLNCLYFNNDRNILYNSANISNCVEFICGSNEGASGAAVQAQFVNVSRLLLSRWYCEGASGIPAIIFDNCAVEINGLYLNGTGGINCGANDVLLTMKHVGATSSTDVFTASGGSGQTISMQQCAFPSSGNTLPSAPASVSLKDTSINGTLYVGDWVFELAFRKTPTNYADDTAAAAGGLAVGQVYRTGSALKVRVS